MPIMFSPKANKSLLPPVKLSGIKGPPSAFIKNVLEPNSSMATKTYFLYFKNTVEFVESVVSSPVSLICVSSLLTHAYEANQEEEDPIHDYNNNGIKEDKDHHGHDHGRDRDRDRRHHHRHDHYHNHKDDDDYKDDDEDDRGDGMKTTANDVDAVGCEKF
ncbi:hypothetical protein BU24DRAFT_473232 [Aaosphaeria arxii CBS 175.79]|uniref:Uncharacterized protein n=1 Tax=Aaosphaeria arxii CBS 175.79 TaxID=1450172 RepID=A0A6A5XAS7_9PLEO|nr:uncharacterized protein BU24DRAFT_473232 [Aaosphaeria arxii CBS 175.79]KAF2010041.1 hypothetical protein BU24DRAFT_473232 [Aaosphaeria arxii CBS 175.79]